MKNRYIHRAKISEKKFRQMLHLFCLDLTASQIAEITGFNRNTVNRYMAEIRSRISDYCRRQAEAYYSGSTKEDRRARQRPHKISTEDVRLIGLVKTNGKIRCRMITGQVAKQLGHTDGMEKNGNRRRMTAVFENCNGIIDLRRMKYLKLQPGENGENGGGRRIDICEGFWGVAWGRLQRFRGLRKSTLPLHIQECEFRYNHSQKELYPLLLKIIREQPLFQ